MKDTRQPKLKTIIKEADSVSIGIARLRNKQPQVLFAVKSPTLANRFSVRLYLFSGGQYLKSANDTFGFSCEDKPLTYAGRALDAAILHCMQGTNQWPDKARVLEAAQNANRGPSAERAIVSTQGNSDSSHSDPSLPAPPEAVSSAKYYGLAVGCLLCLSGSGAPTSR